MKRSDDIDRAPASERDAVTIPAAELQAESAAGRDVTLLTAQALLGIPVDEPERVFSAPDRITAQWRALAARWHPDTNPSEPRATEVLQHLTALYAAAKAKLAAGTWETPGRLVLTATDGRRFVMRYRRRSTFELGEIYVGRTAITYAVDAGERAAFEAAATAIADLKFANDAMRREMSRCLPAIAGRVETADRLCLVLDKRGDEVLLADLLEHLAHRIDPRHVAWIISGLMSIACYLGWAGLMHGSIAPDTVLVSARSHSVRLAGGWWTALPLGAPIAVLPERTARLVCPTPGRAPAARGSIDGECIRQVAREALGDRAGSRLLSDPDIPRPLSQWLASAPPASAGTDYRDWETAREAAFGKRRFVELAVDPDAIYPPVPSTPSAKE